VFLELKLIRVDLFPGWLIGLNMEPFEVCMFQGLNGGQTLLGVENKQLLKQIDGLRAGIGKDPFEVLVLTLLTLLNKSSPLLRFNLFYFFFGGCADKVENQFKLMLSMLSFENSLPPQDLSHDATDRPHVHRTIVFGRVE